MTARHPSVSMTSEGLVIRIPWNAVHIGPPLISSRKRRLTAQDVLAIVDSGRLAHRLGNTRSVQSLKELLA